MKLNKLAPLVNIYEKYPLQQHHLKVYALIDAAQESRFLEWFEHLKQGCLLTEAAGEQARKVSPHLVCLPANFTADEWEFIENKAAGTAKLTLIVSPLGFNALFEHLRKFVEVKFVDGNEMFLAFWDPQILATLLGHTQDQSLYVKEQVFSAEQKNALMQPIQTWWYWNRHGQLHHMIGQGQNLTEPVQLQTPLAFTVQQEEKIVEATLPDNLMYYLKENNQFLINGLSDAQLYEKIKQDLEDAKTYELYMVKDLLNFICLKLMYKENFETDPSLNTLFEQLKQKQITMDDLMQKIMQG